MKKKIILIVLIIIIFLIDCYILYNYIFIRYKNKFMLEKTDIALAQELSNSPFVVDKIILYSSAYGENKNINFQNSNWILDIFQYTDIAIYLNSKEPIKTLSVSNIKFSNDSQKIYYLDSTTFGTEQFIKDYEIIDELEFSVLNFDNKDNSIGYNTPVFFADSSNPITLKYVNTLFENYSIKNTEKLLFNGSLLSKTPIKLEDLSANISLDINVSDYNNQTYTSTLNIDIPIKSDTSTILDGYIYFEKDLNTPFFQIIK